MRFAIKSHISVGPIEFGMKQKQVKEVLGLEPTPFKRNSFSTKPTDYYELLGVFVYYKMDGTAEAIEFGLPSASPLLEEHNLLNISFESLKDMLCSFDSKVLLKSDSATSYSLGISAWTPSPEEARKPAQSIIVFDKGYYD